VRDQDELGRLERETATARFPQMSPEVRGGSDAEAARTGCARRCGIAFGFAALALPPPRPVVPAYVTASPSEPVGWAC
jgi:hypothetical protein